MLDSWNHNVDATVVKNPEYTTTPRSTTDIRIVREADELMNFAPGLWVANVEVEVIDIDLERRRISLSVKQADEDYTEEFDVDDLDHDFLTNGDNLVWNLDVALSQLVPFGAFVRVEEGIEGRVDISELRSEIGQNSINLAEKLLGGELSSATTQSSTIDTFLSELDSVAPARN